MSPGLYVHVPFCAALCPYCDFAVVVGRADAHARYCDALLAEADAAGFDGPFGSVFVGGGTPTFVEPDLLVGALRRLRDRVGWDEGAEFTIEANPDSVGIPGLRAYAAAGVNRVSIGAQSFAPHVLRALGRTHDPSAVDAAVAAARTAGIAAVGLDLIYGSTDETTEDWLSSLRSAIALEPDHISCYALTIEERTAFGRAVESGEMPEPDHDALAERYELAAEMLGVAGYEHYEISNWARPGARCAHNLTYWTQGDYLGLGVGAHSHRDGTRWWNTRSLSRYLADPTRAREGEEHLGGVARAEEWLMLRLRLLDGLDVRDATARLGRDLGDAAASLERDGLIERRDATLRLTLRGMLLENEVAGRLLAA